MIISMAVSRVLIWFVLISVYYSLVQGQAPQQLPPTPKPVNPPPTNPPMVPNTAQYPTATQQKQQRRSRAIAIVDPATGKSSSYGHLNHACS